MKDLACNILRKYDLKNKTVLVGCHLGGDRSPAVAAVVASVAPELGIVSVGLLIGGIYKVEFMAQIGVTVLHGSTDSFKTLDDATFLLAAALSEMDRGKENLRDLLGVREVKVLTERDLGVLRVMV